MERRNEPRSASSTGRHAQRAHLCAPRRGECLVRGAEAMLDATVPAPTGDYGRVGVGDQLGKDLHQVKPGAKCSRKHRPRTAPTRIAEDETSSGIGHECIHGRRTVLGFPPVRSRPA
jgi:hypothetical protein